MADANQNPLTQSFGEMVTQWERNFDAFANQVMGTEAYSQAMNEMQKTQLGAQKQFAQHMAQMLAGMNLPSREDMLQLMDMVQQLDARMERIEESLKRGKSGSKSSAGRKRPPRTKQPPAAAQTQAGPADADAANAAAPSAAAQAKPDTSAPASKES